MKEVFYIDEMGEAQCKIIYKNRAEKIAHEKSLRQAAKERHDEYWNSRTEAEKAIIVWCRDVKNEAARKHCLFFADCRQRMLDAFYRFKTGGNTTPKSTEKCEFVYQYFEEFKQFVKEQK